MGCHTFRALPAIACLVLPLTLAGCGIQPPQTTSVQSGQFTAGDGALQVDFSATTKSVFGKDVFHFDQAIDTKSAVLMRVDKNGRRTMLPLISTLPHASQRARVPVVSLQVLEDTHPVFSTASTDRNLKVVYVDPEQLTREEFDAVARGLQEHRPAIEAAFQRDVTVAGATARFEAPSLRAVSFGPTPYRWPARRDITLEVASTGRAVLSIPYPVSPGSTPFYHHVTVGIVVGAGPEIVLCAPGELQQHRSLTPSPERDWIESVLSRAQLAEVYDKCRDHQQQGLLDHYKPTYVPADQIAHKIARVHIDMTGGIAPRVQMLASGDQKSATEAARTLGEAGPLAREALPALTRALSQRQLASAAEAIFAIDPDAPETRRALIAGLEHAKTLEECSYLLGNLGGAAAPAVPQLIAQLQKNRDRRPCDRLMSALVRIAPDSPAAHDAIAGCLQAKNRETRYSAVWTLGELGPQASTHAHDLQEVLKDPEARFRLDAAYSLFRMGEPPASFMPTLIEGLKRDEERDRALTHIRQIGPPARDALPVLEQLREEYKRRSLVDDQIRQAMIKINAGK